MPLAAGIGYAIYRHEKKKKKEKEERQLIESAHISQLITNSVSESEQLSVNSVYDDLTVQKRITFASFIRGMYRRASNEPNYSQCWESHHYELVPLNYILTKEDMQRCQHYLEKEEKYKYFGVLRKKNTSLACPVAPEWVVAVRGTDKTSLHDIMNDVKIALERLHTSSTVELLKIVVSRLVTYKGPGCSQVAVTGHSLGASTAMVVARELALEGCAIDSHFFNPPFATISALARNWVRTFFAPISALTKGRKVHDKFSRIEVGLSLELNLLLDGGERMRKQFLEYNALARWSPFLYLNENDPVCQLYISHFAKRSVRKARVHENIYAWYSIGSALLQATFGDAETFHLMPRAICCIAQTDRHRPLNAHSLDNWSLHDVPLEIKPVNLSVEVTEESQDLIGNVAHDRIGEGSNEQKDWFQEGLWFRD